MTKGFRMWQIDGRRCLFHRFWKIIKPAGTQSPPHLLQSLTTVCFFYFGSVVLIAVSFIAAQPECMLSLLFFFFTTGSLAHSSSHSEYPCICTHPNPRLGSLWVNAKFDFEFSVQESKGPLGNSALSLQGKRKIRGNQLLPLYSISHSPCSLIHFVVYQEKQSFKAMRGMWEKALPIH